MDIRKLVPDDAPAWLAIRERMLTEHPESFGSDVSDLEGTSVAEIEMRIAKNSGPDAVMYGAFENDNLVGTIGFFQDGGTKRKHIRVIWGTYVAPEVRRRNCGRLLIERALVDLRKLEGVKRVALDVSHSSPAARALYESFGFESYGVEPDSLLVEGRLVDTTLMTLRI